ncbi:hypothetical protein HAZT_HAZT007240 [Hyalella azteca]|uniref:BTB domain-containing protein n=1 Tax=Hyalella azteca TaxID=294128 RepID=A0A6A0HAT3_HYAAZ|nr:hypothetical protein HAZT_HAZT007240 [Hyalella azteca]
MDSSGLLSLKWNNHSSTFTGVLSHLRINNLYTDATLACEGKVFSVHKLVLSTCSEYFQKIFEETDCRRPVIVLKDIKHTELDALLNYMYLGEIILDEEIKSEAFSPKLEDVDDYEANPSFDEAAQVSSAASSIQSSMQHHRPSADSVAHEDEGTANSEPKNSNSIQQDFSSDDILTRLGGGDVGGGAGAINVHSYILDANEYYDKDNDHEDVVCTSSPAVVSMSPRSCSTPDDGCKASRLGGGVGDTSSSSDVLHSALKDATDATCASSRLRDEDSSNAALRASAFSSDDFSSMSRDLDLTCGRRFNQKHHLRHHTYTHTGERPYACPHCEQTFTQTSSRNKHIKTMHPDVGFTSLSMVAPRYDVT